MKLLRGKQSKTPRRSWLIAVMVCCGLFSVVGMTGAFPEAIAASRALTVEPLARPYSLLAQPTPPTDATCRMLLAMACYRPQELYRAYDVNKVLNAGFTGKGQTIVIVDADGSPTIKHDLHTFDAGFGLPDPPSFRVLAPLGPTMFNPLDPAMVFWAYETSLDVEWAHALAPDANIVLLVCPDGDPYSPLEMKNLLKLEQYALRNHLGSIISQSWGITENTFFLELQDGLLDQCNQFYRQAAQQHVTVFAASGDTGSTGFTTVPEIVYPFPTVFFPASSPWVTAVGGTTLHTDTQGSYQSEQVWNNPPLRGASGGGISQYFAEPDYQRSLPAASQALLQNHRGLPDVAYDADFQTGVLIYTSFLLPGYIPIGGTSAAAPQWAGMIADANQMAGRPLGFLNGALYRIGASASYTRVFHDIVKGNNGYDGIPGYSATTGWDPTTGWGTPRVGELLPYLIQATKY